MLAENRDLAGRRISSITNKEESRQAFAHEKSQYFNPRSEISVVRGEILQGMFVRVPQMEGVLAVCLFFPPWKTIPFHMAEVWICRELGGDHYLQNAGKVSGMSKLCSSEVALFLWR